MDGNRGRGREGKREEGGRDERGEVGRKGGSEAHKGGRGWK